MKRNLVKQARTILMLVTIGVAFAACNKDVLNTTNLNAVDPNIWNTFSSTNEFLNGTYDLVMPNWPTPGSIHNTSDELNSVTVSIINGTLTGSGNEITDIGSANKQTNDPYWWIYRCNLAIAGLNNGTMDAASKTSLKGQFFFLRAYEYFTLWRIYGGIPLILQVQDPSNINALSVARSKSSVCLKQIVADFDSAEVMLPASWPLATDGGRITRAVAYAYAGKALLYWASPQFNPSTNNPNYDPTRWTDAYNACKAAYLQAQADGYALYTTSTSPTAGFGSMWTDETANNHERMMWRTLDAVSVNPTHGTTNELNSRPVSETTGGGASNCPTWNVVQAFPMADGTPISNSTILAPSNTYIKNYTAPSGALVYDPVMYWNNRDPRFAQTIAYNGCIWNLSGKSNRHEWTYTGFLDDVSKPSTTGFYCRKICNPAITAAQTPVNSTTGGGSGMDWVELRFAEVLLNYAEAANNLPGGGGLAECQGLLATLRAARGLTQGTANYGVNVIQDQTSMNNVLLNERVVEFAMEGKRYWDLRRTRSFDKLTGSTVSALKLTVNSPYVAGALPASPVAGKTYIDVAPTGGGRVCDTLNVNNKSTYTKFFTPSVVNLVPSGGSAVINYPTTYYFYPLPQAFIQSSVLVQQTLGWTGGSFDPLQ